MIDEALPPQNLEAEAGVIGSALLDPQQIDDLSLIVAPDDFYRDSHEIIWREIIAVRDSGAPVDAVTLIEQLGRKGLVDKVGGAEAVVGLIADTPHAANAEYYAKIVKAKSTSRQLVELGHRLVRDGYSNQFDADELLRRADADLCRVAEGANRKELATIGEAARDSLRRFDLRRAGESTGLETGFRRLDSILGGLRPAQLVILGARPGMGKTAIVMNILENVAVLTGRPALFVSLEMGLGELGDRAVCSSSGVDSSDYRHSQAKYVDRSLVEAKVAELEGLPILIEETPDLTPSQIAAVARKARRRGDLGLVVVDYLQIVGSDDRRDSEYDRVGKAARALKNLSKQVKAPVIALSQLNRQCEEREDKRPRLIDLRATGQIEQEADVVAFLFREGYYDPLADQRKAELVIAKNREGALGTVDLLWNGRLTKFFDPPEHAGGEGGDGW